MREGRKEGERRERRREGGESGREGRRERGRKVGDGRLGGRGVVSYTMYTACLAWKQRRCLYGMVVIHLAFSRFLRLTKNSPIPNPTASATDESITYHVRSHMKSGEGAYKCSLSKHSTTVIVELLWGLWLASNNFRIRKLLNPHGGVDIT